MKVIILAGGKGTRLWPFSRETWPKQFLNISAKSLIEETIERNLFLVKPNDIFISTNSDYYFFIKEIIFQYQIPEKNIFIEPESRNTAPAILFSLLRLKKREIEGKEIIAVFASDHFIKPKEKFKETIKKAEKTASKGFLTILGLKPDSAETGYGYIKVDSKFRVQNSKVDFYKVERFVEKPGLEKAKEYLISENYFWNLGIFVFPLDTIIKEFKKLAPKIFEAIIKGEYQKSPELSIDNAIMEKSKITAMIKADFQWLDIGSWLAIHQIKPKDNKKNVCIGEKILLEKTKNSLIIGGKKLIVGIGLENIIVVNTPDAILVSHQQDVSRLKGLIKQMKEKKYSEIFEHQTVYRPWGNYTVLEKAPGYKVKRIVVKAGEKLSLQLHHYRSEHWIVIKGEARVKIKTKEFTLKNQESIFIPKNTLHRLMNLTKEPLEIIEIQNGDYLSEDDIERFDDKYNRE